MRHLHAGRPATFVSIDDPSTHGVNETLLDIHGFLDPVLGQIVAANPAKMLPPPSWAGYLNPLLHNQHKLLEVLAFLPRATIILAGHQPAFSGFGHGGLAVIRTAVQLRRAKAA